MWLLGIPLLGKSRVAAVIGFGLMVCGGLLAYAKARWMPSWGLKAGAFVTGSVATGFGLGVIDAVMKLFSYSTNRGVQFLCRNPLGIVLGILIALAAGFVAGILGFALFSLLRWTVKSPSRKWSRVVWAVSGALCLTTGAYFLFVYHKEHWEWIAWYPPAWHRVAYFGTAGLLALTGLLIVGQLVFSRRREQGIPLRVAVVVSVAILFFVQVEIFGLWLRNDDMIYNAMNKSLTGLSALSTGAMDRSGSIELSPDGTRMLKTLGRRDSFTSAVLDIEGRLIGDIRLPDGINTGPAMMKRWSPDSSMVAGIAYRWSSSSRERAAYLWKYRVRDRHLECREIGMFTNLVAQGSAPVWSPDSKSLAVPGHGAPKQEVDLVLAESTFSVYKKTSVEYTGNFVVLYSSSDLHEMVRLPASISSRWALFVDNSHLLYYSRSVVQRVSTRASAEALVVLDTASGEERALDLDHEVAQGHYSYEPVLVRGRKAILVGLVFGKTVRPCLVDISTGRSVLLSGLDPARSLMIAGFTWDRSCTDTKGEVALISIFDSSSVWPHAVAPSIYQWREGKSETRLIRYLPVLSWKWMPTIGGDRAAFLWNGAWYQTRLMPDGGG